MSLKYIAYRNENEEPLAVVFFDLLMHSDIHAILHRQQPRVFTTVTSAGFTYYDVKKKKFAVYGDSATLNTISQPEDAELVHTAMTKSGPADALILPTYEEDNWSFLFAPKELIQTDALSKKPYFGRGTLSHHVHNSDTPFKIVLSELKGLSVTPEYLNYCERFFA